MNAKRLVCGGLFSLAALLPALSQADAVTEWDQRSNDVLYAAKMPPPMTARTLALAHVATYEAVNAITRRYPPSGRVTLQAPEGASTDAAVAAAMRASLEELLPAQRETIAAAYADALANLPDGAARRDGIAVGEAAAAAVLAARRDDGAFAVDNHVPFAQAGRYVPTTSVAVPHWGRRKPWVLASGDTLRPGPPPALDSAAWVRDYNEIRQLGRREGSTRTDEQTLVARFWEANGPVVYFPIARGVAAQPGREITRNARLMAAVSVAMDDALIAVFDAKYAYNFWRPVTAIRNGDQDGNDATVPDPAWLPLIETPMHPEYPCAHCTVAGAVAAVLQAEIGDGPVPPLATTSPLLPGVTRRWTSLQAFAQEVSEARIGDGVHFRTSTEVGTTLGDGVGRRVAAQMLD
jgi:hypothetical protein